MQVKFPSSFIPTLPPRPLSSKVNFGLRKQQALGRELGIVGVNKGMLTNIKWTLDNAETFF